MANESDHLPLPEWLAAGVPPDPCAGSCLAPAAAFRLSVVHARNHPTQLRDLVGFTSTEVKNARSSSKVIPRTNCPLYAYEIEPVSSETTTTTASVSSLKPIAARCRVPR